MSTCSERGGVVGRMFDCSSSRVDHTECCKAAGVEGKCLEYCAAHDGVPTNYLGVFLKIKQFLISLNFRLLVLLGKLRFHQTMFCGLVFFNLKKNLKTFMIKY